MNVWNRILEWWYDTRDRHEYILFFNRDFKNSFRLGVFPVLLRVSICSGHPDFSTQFSKHLLGFSRSGIKIEAMTNNSFFINKHVSSMLAMVILSNDRMCRDLLSLGFDTLWVGEYCWKLQNFSLPPSSDI